MPPWILHPAARPPKCTRLPERHRGGGGPREAQMRGSEAGDRAEQVLLAVDDPRPERRLTE